MDCLRLRRSVELLKRELADRFEHPETARLPSSKEALVHQGLQRVERGDTDRFCGFERRGAREGGQSSEQDLVIRDKEVIAPRDRCAQRLLPRSRVTSAPG